MALMVYYCERHRCAWPHSHGNIGKCPLAPGLQPDYCPIKSVDAIEQINDLGGEIRAAEEKENDY